MRCSISKFKIMHIRGNNPDFIYTFLESNVELTNQERDFEVVVNVTSMKMSTR